MPQLPIKCSKGVSISKNYRWNVAVNSQYIFNLVKKPLVLVKNNPKRLYDWNNLPAPYLGPFNASMHCKDAKNLTMGLRFKRTGTRKICLLNDFVVQILDISRPHVSVFLFVCMRIGYRVWTRQSEEYSQFLGFITSSDINVLFSVDIFNKLFLTKIILKFKKSFQTFCFILYFNNCGCFISLYSSISAQSWELKQIEMSQLEKWAPLIYLMSSQLESI